MSILESLFCHIDDFCKCFEPQWKKRLLTEGKKTRQRTRILCLSEIMTILVSFHQNHYRNFKHYYTDHVAVYWRDAFPHLPSYQRFIEWIPSTQVTSITENRSKSLLVVYLAKFLLTRDMFLKNYLLNYLSILEFSFLPSLKRT